MITWWMLFKIIFLYLLLFYILPLSVQSWGNSENWKDRFFISIIHSHLFFIFVIHFLVLLHIHETFSLMFVSIIGYIFFIRKRQKTDTLSPLMKVILSILEATEQKKGFHQWKKKAFNFVSFRFKEFVKTISAKIFRNAFSMVLLLSVLGISAYIRFDHSINHLYYGASDPYVHLKWVKHLRANEIYVDGVYPFGFEAIISSLHTLFQIDPYFLLRFLGPLSGMMLVFTIYYVARSLHQRTYSVALFALIIYFFSSFQFGFIWRQYSSLSMEYGMIFILLGIYFFLKYLKENNNVSLIFCMECFLLTVLIHPYAAICLFISYIVLFLYGLKRFTLMHLLRLVGGFAISGLIGILPLLIGLLSGKQFHGESIKFVQDSIKTNSIMESAFSVTTLVGGNEFIMVFLAIFFVTAILMLWKREKSQPLFIYTLIAFVFFILYRAEFIGLPTIMLPYRIEVFMVIIMSVSIASLISIIPEGKRWKLAKAGIVLVFIFISFFKAPSLSLPKGNRLHYDEAVEAYLEIKKNFPLQEWTIISPIEEYPLSIDYGWHYNLTDFIAHLANGQEMKFPTKDIFLYVEKIPIGYAKPVSAKSASNFSLPKVEKTLDMYRIPEYRSILEEKTWYFVERMQEKHPGILKLYVDSPHFKVYHIEQDPKSPYDFSALLSRE